jgi:ribosomal protein S18 acetylase RimI-like enzyme
VSNWEVSEELNSQMRDQALVREYETRDRRSAEDLLRVGIEDQQVFAALASPPEDDDFIESEMEEHLAGLDVEPSSWWVAEASDGTVVGCLWVRAADDALGPYRTVRQIIVSPSFQRRGIGAALLGMAEEVSRASDAVMLLISGYGTNPALDLYRRVGFTEFHSKHRRDPNPNNVVLWMPFKI